MSKKAVTVEQAMEGFIAELTIDYSIIPVLGRSVYSSMPLFVVLRELLQNSTDAKAKHIEINTSVLDNGDLVITFIDDGIGIQDFLNHFLKFGGSSKRTEDGNIGGFGIAKIAVFASKDWYCESNGWRVTKDMMMNKLRSSKSTRTIGTEIQVVIDSSQVPYAWERTIKEFVCTSNLPPQILVNGNVYDKYTEQEVVLPSNNKVTLLGSSGGYLKARINGLLMFTSSISGWKDYAIDFQLSGDPYSETYPLTANRDGFRKSTPEYKLFEFVENELNQVYQAQVELQKIEKMKLEFYRGIPAMCVESLDDETATPVFLKKCSDVLKAITKTLEITQEIVLGFTGDSSAFATFVQDSTKYFGKPVILVNPSYNNNPYELFDSIVHELVHLVGVSGHYDQFTNVYEGFMVKLLPLVYDHTIKF